MNPRRPAHRSPPSPQKYPAERVISGVHSILEALRVHGRDCIELWTSERQLPKPIFEKAQSLKLKVTVVKEDELKKFGQHQGVILFAKPLPELNVLSLIKPKARLLILDEIEDPHNLGAILRTSWLMGVDGIIMSNRRTVSLSASAHKVASGGAEHVPILSVGNFGNIFQQLKDQGFWIFGLAGEAETSIARLKIHDKVAWVLGSEESGLRTTTRNLCDELVSLPQSVSEASFNVSVAAALTLAYSGKF